MESAWKTTVAVDVNFVRVNTAVIHDPPLFMVRKKHFQYLAMGKDTFILNTLRLEWNIVGNKRSLNGGSINYRE